MTSDSRLREGRGAVNAGTKELQCAARCKEKIRRTEKEKKGHAPTLDVCNVDCGRLDAGGTVAKHLRDDGSVHGLPRGGVVKVKRSGGNAVVPRYVGPQVVRVKNAVHATVFVSDSFGAISERR
jgi:hypothetical protein